MHSNAVECSMSLNLLAGQVTRINVGFCSWKKGKQSIFALRTLRVKAFEQEIWRMIFSKQSPLRLSTCCMFLISKCTTSRGAGAVRHNARTCELLVWINFVLRLLSLHLTRTEALPRLFCSRRAFSRSEERPHGLYDSYFVENPFTPRSEKEILLGNLKRKKLCRVYQMRSGIALPEETRLGILLTEVHYLN